MLTSYCRLSCPTYPDCMCGENWNPDRSPTLETPPMPDPNPKALQAARDGKAPLDYLEPACDAGEARVLRDGAKKYGRRNYRDTEMLWTTYLGSMRRHLLALAQSEDLDPDTGEHHLFHIRANTAVLLGAMDAGTLRDDRDNKHSTQLSDRVHIDGDQDAKSLCSCGKSLGRCSGMCVSPPLTADYDRGIDERAEEMRRECSPTWDVPVVCDEQAASRTRRPLPF